MQTTQRRLHRSRANRIIGGVCGGLAEYFSVDATLVRLVFVVLSIGGGFGVALYLVLWLIVPPEGKEDEQVNVEQRVRAVGEEFQDTAHKVAEEFRSSTTTPGSSMARRNFFALLIVAIGVLLLLQQFFSFHWFRGDLLWPLAIIIVGIYLLTRR